MQSALPGAIPDSVVPAYSTEPETTGNYAREDMHISPSIGGKTALYTGTKRILDLVFGTIGLAATGVVGLIVVPMILRRSPGASPIFAQERVGKDGKTFICYKFRTMEPDADARKPEIAHLNEVDGPVFKIAADPRHVASLRWLRKYSIDEMPQFWNVVRGEMSLVGPRPPVPDEVAHYTPEQLGRLAVKPGLTCTWQVNGRSDVGFDHWVAMDLDYISRRSTWLDLSLIVKTIPAIFSGRGAS